jgi:hypothetical protein
MPTGPFFGNRSQDRQRDRMIAAHRQRRYASRMDGSEEGSDFGERALQFEGPFDPGIPQIGDTHEVEGRHADRLVDLADERGLVADIAWAVARDTPSGCRLDPGDYPLTTWRCGVIASPLSCVRHDNAL